MTDDLRRTAGRWRTGDSSPLSTFAGTGTIVPGVDDEIRQSLEIVERGGLAFAEFDPIEEYEELRDLLEHVELGLALDRARQLGGRDGTSAAARWQNEVGGSGALGPTTPSVQQFMEAVDERDPPFVDALPVPPGDFTVTDLARRSEWREPDLDDRRAHDQWTASHPDLWDAYEIAFYDAVRESIAQWRRSDTPDPGQSLDQRERDVAPDVRQRTLRVQIVDDDALSALTPEAIRLHLGRQGWRRDVPAGSRPDIWALRTPEGAHEVLAPWAPTAPDYPMVVRELLRTLSIVEDRSELDIFRDLDPVAHAERVGGTSSTNDVAETLQKLAEARRDYATARDQPALDQTLMLHEAAVMDRVADALSGRASWGDLVAGYAPPWRWHQFAEHDPQLTRSTAPDAASQVMGRASGDQQVPSSRSIQPFIRPVADAGVDTPSAHQPLPASWIAEPIGRWRGTASEVVYDPRRFDTTITGSRFSGTDSAVANLEAIGWEELAADGSTGLWVRDRVAVARRSLARFDQQFAGIEADGPQVVAGPPTPGVEL